VMRSHNSELSRVGATAWGTQTLGSLSPHLLDSCHHHMKTVSHNKVYNVHESEQV
jgi:hypothetical protein